MRPSRIGDRLDIYRVTRLPRRVNDWLMEPSTFEDVIEASGVTWYVWEQRRPMDVSHWMRDGEE